MSALPVPTLTPTAQQKINHDLSIANRFYLWHASLSGILDGLLLYRAALCHASNPVCRYQMPALILHFPKPLGLPCPPSEYLLAALL